MSVNNLFNKIIVKEKTAAQRKAVAAHPASNRYKVAPQTGVSRAKNQPPAYRCKSAKSTLARAAA